MLPRFPRLSPAPTRRTTTRTRGRRRSAVRPWCLSRRLPQRQQLPGQHRQRRRSHAKPTSLASFPATKRSTLTSTTRTTRLTTTSGRRTARRRTRTLSSASTTRCVRVGAGVLLVLLSLIQQPFSWPSLGQSRQEQVEDGLPRRHGQGERQGLPVCQGDVRRRVVRGTAAPPRSSVRNRLFTLLQPLWFSRRPPSSSVTHL
jgi:hypothetical protein